jgi:hypothetical protein
MVIDMPGLFLFVGISYTFIVRHQAHGCVQGAAICRVLQKNNPTF